MCDLSDDVFLIRPILAYTDLEASSCREYNILHETKALGSGWRCDALSITLVSDTY